MSAAPRINRFAGGADARAKLGDGPLGKTLGVGTLVFGWVADRISAVLTLALFGLFSTLYWSGLLLTSDLTIMLVLSAFYGSYLSGIVGIQGAAVGELFPPEQVGRAAGALYLVQLPLMFALPPLIGLLRINSVNYVLPFKALIGVSVIALVLNGGTALGCKRARLAAAA